MSAQGDALRFAARAGYVAALRDGRIQRASTVAPRKGKGSYTRRTKHAHR